MQALSRHLFAGRPKQLEKQLSYSGIAGIFSCFVAAIVTEEIILGTAIGTLVFCIAFLLQVLMPIVKEKKRVAVIESELPFALMSISVDLELNIAFEKCILNASYSGKIAGEFKRVFLDVKEKGMSMGPALLAFSQRTKSTAIKRSVLQLNSVYEQGAGNAQAVRRIAIELLAKQRAKAKEFSGKLVVFSLMFIAVSAIVPALFQSFVIVGSMVLKMQLTAPQIFFTIVAGFPVLNMTVLFYIRAKTPVFLRE